MPWIFAFPVALALVSPWTTLAFALAGILHASSVRAIHAPRGEEAGPLRGRVSSVPRRVDERVLFTLDADRVGRVEVMSPDVPDGAPLALGDSVLLDARVRPPPGARNPGGRDRSALLAARGIGQEASARIPPARVAAPALLSRVEAARTRFGREAARCLPAQEAALVRAIGAGDESALEPALRDAFARSGLAHVLSVSGLHLALVAWGAWRGTLWALLRLDRRQLLDARRWAAAVALPVAAVYALATGASVPVVRSALGAGLALVAVLLGREADARNGLALALLLVLAAEPGSIGDVSFQLSFASVAGLLMLAGPLRRSLPFRPDRGRWPGRLAEGALQAAAASAAASLATAPLLALHFRRLSLLAVPANVVGLPLASVLTGLGALAFLASALVPPAAPLLLWACRGPATAFLAVNAAFAAPALATVGLASPGWGGVLACYGLAVAGLFAGGDGTGGPIARSGPPAGSASGPRASRGRALRVACLAGAAAGLLLPGPLRALAARRSGQLEVVFLSVGQGDAAILRLPDGTAALIDAGGDERGRHDPGARDVLPFLRDMGVRRISAAFVSHPHADHLLGLPAVAEGVTVERLFTPGRPGDEAATAALRRLPPATPLAAGDEVVLSGVRIQVLGPPRAPWSRELTDNDASLVLRVVHGETAFLFPGDAEAEAEALLVEGGGLSADVVKVPHHGSRTSSGPGFVEAVRPRWAVASVGLRNRFAFPHAEAVERWRAAGAELLRTDEAPVRFLSDGRAVRRADPAAAIDAWALWNGR